MKGSSYLEKPNWTTKEVMHFLNCSRSSVNRLISSGALIPYKVGNNLKGANLFKAEEVRKVLKPLFKRISKEDENRFDIKYLFNNGY